MNMKKLLKKFQRRQTVHFLHIGKTGGNSIKHALKHQTKTKIYRIRFHSHRFRLRDAPVGEKAFFAVRDPVDRFVSGFHSRKRKGRPKNDNPWSEEEEAAFSEFKTPNELAESLSDKDSVIKDKAIAAMKAIGHVKTSYWDWFEDEEYFSSRSSDILFVYRQESLDEDFIRSRAILGLREDAKLPEDDIQAHRSPRNVDKHLSEEALKNLKKWYVKEYEFLDILEREDLI